MRWERDGASVTYSADTAPDERVVALARETDVFLCEATLLPRRGRARACAGTPRPPKPPRWRATPASRRLVLTHYGEESTSRDLDEAARAIFGGEIVVADDHRIFDWLP